MLIQIHFISKRNKIISLKQKFLWHLSKKIQFIYYTGNINNLLIF